MPPWKCTADDWVYAGEGGRHVLFSFQARTATVVTSAAVDKGALLRVVKEDIVRYLPLWNAKQPEDNFGKSNKQETIRFLTEKRATTELSYLRHIVAPSLSPFVDIPQVVEVSASLAAGLCHEALESGKIPPHRQASWKVPPEDPAVPFEKEDSVRGMILRDYRLPRTLGTSSAVLSIEIKPKAGYTAISPLVSPHRRIKYQRCRFQCLHRESSAYNPVDLWSRNVSRIRQAIQALWEQPRNNWRLWSTSTSRGAPILGQRDEVPLVLQNWVPGASQSVLVDLVTHVLFEDSDWLHSLLSLQKLDLVDSDGAVRVYDRLVRDFHGGSHEQAWSLLEGDADAVDSTDRGRLHVPPHPRLACCPPALLVGLEGASPSLEKYFTLVDELEKHLLQRTPVDNSYLDQLHGEATSLVDSMTQVDCLVLLRLWLLSLAMCDVSFFVSFQKLEDSPRKYDDEGIMGIRHVSHQSEEGPGVIAFDVGPRTVRVSYEIKAIDCDCKPAKKLLSRRKKEDAVFAEASSTS
jgi:inositol-pentakisphosphate 2-kinase